jgi:hypothetical protein
MRGSESRRYSPKERGREEMWKLGSTVAAGLEGIRRAHGEAVKLTHIAAETHGTFSDNGIWSFHQTVMIY